MGGQDVRRAGNVALTVAGAAAVTTVMLWLFQDSAEAKDQAAARGTPEMQPQADLASQSEPIKPATIKAKEEEERKANEPMRRAGLECIGDGSVLFADYIGGLMQLAKSAAATEHGCGYFANFGTNMVLLTKPEHVRKCLALHVAHDLGGMKAASAAYFGEKVLFILEGKEWRQLRNLMRHSFLPQSLPIMSADVTAVAVELGNRLSQSAGTGRPVDLHFVLSMYHLSAIGRAAYNYDMGCISRVHEGPNAITESFEYLLRELPRRAYSTDAAVREDYTTPNADNKEWRKHADAVRNVVTGVVEARLKARASGAPQRNDMLECMIKSYETETQLRPDDAEDLIAALGDNLVEIFFAGYNTSVAVMAVALYFVAESPELQRRLQEEADNAMSALRPGSSIDVEQLPLCTAVFSESLRLVPPAPLVYRSTTTPTPLAEGLTVPAGTPIWIPAIYLHTDPASWGPDAATFNPDRWLGKTAPHPPGAYIPFSHGPRECLGKYFAKLESVAALAVLFSKYKFQVAPEYDFRPTFTGFGLRPFDAKSQRVSVNLLVEERVTATTMYDWSPSRVVSSRKTLVVPSQLREEPSPFTPRSSSVDVEVKEGEASNEGAAAPSKFSLSPHSVSSSTK